MVYQKLTMSFLGRAIRHKDDWASLILLDSRYQNSRIYNKLPKWIQDVVISSTSFGQSVQLVNQFMRSR